MDKYGWWLSTPYDSDMVYFIYYKGTILDYAWPDDVSGVRPALKLDLSKVTFDSGTNTFSLKPPHTHSFTYTTSGATITATCGAKGCDLPPSTQGGNDHVATLTIAAPLHTNVGDGKSEAATLSGLADFNAATGKNIAATDIKYAGRDGTTYAENATAPTAEGKYTAKITVESKTASVDYEIMNPDYTVTLPTGLVGGTVAAKINDAEVTTAKYNDTVTLTATPNNHYHFNSFTVMDSNNTSITVTGADNIRTFTMPASNVTVSAEFEGDPFNIMVAEMSNGTVTATQNSESVTQAKAGTEVTLTVAPAAGYQLATLKYNDTGIVADKDGNYKFTMPASNVTVSATFELKDVPISLKVTGDTGTTCTAELLHDNFTAVTEEAPLAKKAEEKFILLINRDADYDFKVTYDTDSPATLEEFTIEEYEYYRTYAQANNISVSSSTVMAWVTMPVVAEENVTFTVTFAPLHPFTILYQTNESTEVWCKYSKTENSETVMGSARMHNDTAMSNGTMVYSLRVTSAFSPEKVTFAVTKEAVDAVATESMITCSAKTSAAESDWENTTGGKYLVIGDDAKTVVAAFVTDENAIAFYNSKRGAKPEHIGDGVEYRLAVVVNGNGTVTAPDAPANSDKTIQFAGWWGFEYDGNGKEKVYEAGANVPVGKNTTFIDRWEPKQLTVTLNRNGGTGGSSTTTATYGNPMTAPEAPTRNGFAFDGWTVSKNVTENGELFVKGTPFVDLKTPITADMGLTAQWKHVHSYTCCRVTRFPNLQEYHSHDSSVHVALCNCRDAKLVAHEFDSDGKCACGYQKPEPVSVKLDISYGQWDTAHNTYTQHFKGLPQPMNPKSGEEVTISAPDIFGEYSQFSKWQFSTDGENWTDLAAAEEVSFIIPCDMKVRGLYVNTVTDPQVELSASKYELDIQDGNKNQKANTILYQMHYKLPDGCTFVDAGVRLGDNDGIVYYELKEKTTELSAGKNAANWAGGFVTSLLTFTPPEFTDTSYTERYYEVRKTNAATDLGAAKLAKYMYESEPVSVKAEPILYESKATTKGSHGSVATLTPLALAQAENQNNWVYGIGWLRYKKLDGTIETIYTEALPATLNHMPTNSVTKQGS